MARDRRGDGRAATAIGDMNKIKIERRAEKFACQMRASAYPRRGVTEFAGIDPYLCNEFLHGICGYRRVHGDDLHCRGGDCHGIEVANGIIKCISLEDRIGDEGHTVHEEDRVTVWSGLGCSTCANAAA